MTRETIDTTSPAARRARAALARAGVEVWVHGEVYGLVRDESHPTGWRLVGRAPSLEALARKLAGADHPKERTLPAEPAVLCSLSRGGAPVVDQAGADEAALLVNPDAPRLAEADDASMGLWLIALPEEVLRRLEERGYLEVDAGPYHLSAEMP